MIPDFSERLLRWFDENGRKNLPWQQDISAYRVWLSEIMLQQTQVATVIPYFDKFTQKFPIINQLAAATEDEVLHLWTGLGYYARARNLHKAAKIVTDQYNGEFPHSLEELEALPGIGKSTAGAILSIAHQIPATILDGNVKRTLSRCFGIEGWPGQGKVAQQFWRQAEILTPTIRVADYTQAIMDIGATLCTRTNPQCERCPFAGECIALAENRVSELPTKKPKKTMPVKNTHMLMIKNQHSELLLLKRPASGIWGGLWSFPECEENSITETLDHLGLSSEQIDSLPPFRHTFTHYHLDITPVLIEPTSSQLRVNEQKSCWFNPNKPLQIGLTRPVTKLLEQFLNQ